MKELRKVFTRRPKLIMNPDHPKWDKLCERLQGEEGCDFKKNNGSYTWKCGGENKTIAICILNDISKNIDIEGTIKYFEETGGFCDCEIVFNTIGKLDKYINNKD